MSNESPSLPYLLKPENLFDLPVAVYLVQHDGTFLWGNRRLCELLGISEELPLTEQSITAFYRDENDRSRLLREVEDAESQGQLLEKATTTFVIHGRERSLQVYCRSVRREKPTAKPDYLGCLIDVTEEEALRNLLDQLPAGIYKADEENRLLHVNQSVVRMFGFNATSEMQGMFASDFLAKAEDSRFLDALRENKEPPTTSILEMKRKDGSRFHASLHVSRRVAGDDRYLGHEGTIEDINERVQLRALIDQTPLGLYRIAIHDGKQIIQECNDSFAHIFGLNSASEALNRDIREIQKIDENFEKFVALLREKEAQGDILSGYLSHITPLAPGSQPITIEVNCRLLRKTDTGEEIGRIGVLRDVTAVEQMRERINILTKDIGNVLHSYESMLINFRNATRPLRNTIAFGLQCKSPTDREALFIDLDESASSLKKVLAEVAQHSDDPTRDPLFSEKDTVLVKKFSALIDNYDKIIPFREIQATTLHEVANTLAQLSDRLRSRRSAPRELDKRLRETSLRVAKICGLISLARSEDSVLLNDYGVRALRDFVTKGIRKREERAVFPVDALLNQAIKNLADFSRWRHVELRLPNKMSRVLVCVQEREVVRAITNILHNALKYSWRREDGAWVAVRFRVARQLAVIEVENYGVPIPIEEIRTGIIFGIGVRGRLAGDRGRVGTGIGLSDAREVLQENAGSLEINSTPAVSGARFDDYSKPFLTTAIISLPIYEEHA